MQGQMTIFDFLRSDECEWENFKENYLQESKKEDYED